MSMAHALLILTAILSAPVLAQGDNQKRGGNPPETEEAKKIRDDPRTYRMKIVLVKDKDTGKITVRIEEQSEGCKLITDRGHVIAEAVVDTTTQGQEINALKLLLKRDNEASMLFLRNHAQNASFPTCQPNNRVLIESDASIGGKLLTLFSQERSQVEDSIYCINPVYSPDCKRVAYLSRVPLGQKGTFATSLVVYDFTLRPSDNYPEASLRSMHNENWTELCLDAFYFDPERRGIILYPFENVDSGEYVIEKPDLDEPLCPRFLSAPLWSPSGNLLAILHFGNGQMRLVWADLSRGTELATISTRVLDPTAFVYPDRKEDRITGHALKRIEFQDGEHAILIHPGVAEARNQPAPVVIPLIPEERRGFSREEEALAVKAALRSQPSNSADTHPAILPPETSKSSTIEVLPVRTSSGSGLQISERCPERGRKVLLSNEAIDFRFPPCRAGSNIVIESDAGLRGKIITLFDPKGFRVVDAFFGFDPTYSPDGTRIVFKRRKYSTCTLYDESLVLYDLTRTPHENGSAPFSLPEDDRIKMDDKAKAAFPFDPDSGGIPIFSTAKSGKEESCPVSGPCPQDSRQGFCSPFFWSPSGRFLAFLHFSKKSTRLVWVDFELGVDRAKILMRTLKPALFARTNRPRSEPSLFIADRIEFLESERVVRIQRDEAPGSSSHGPESFEVPLVPSE